MKSLFVVLALSVVMYGQGAASSSNYPTTGGSSFSGGAAGTSYQDVTETAAPANPAAATSRIYSDSTTHFLTCLTTSGGNCFGAFAPLANPTFTGTPAAPTPGTNVNTTQIPTTAWVNTFYAPIASPSITGTLNVMGATSGSSGLSATATGGTLVTTTLGTSTNPWLQGLGAASNTGIYFPSTTSLALVSAGIEVLRLGGTVSVASAGGLAFTSSTSSGGARDLSLCRFGIGILEVANSTTCNAGGFVKSAQTLQVITSDVSNTSATLATITGLTITFPLVAANWTFTCDLVYSQATAAVANQIGVQTATNGATNLTASAVAYITTSTFTAGAVTDVASTTTAQSVVTFTPGATGVKLPIHLSGVVEGASASGTVLNIQALTGNVSDALTFYRGSQCWIN